MRRLPPILLVVLVLATACVPIPPPLPATPTPALSLAERLPVDPAIRTGRLDNGLTYYIRHNAEPAKRAELWLAVNAGSVMEEDNQKGLAHFLEHMMFKGTQHFQGKALLDFLESVGMRFGPEINAYTSFDETVYTLQAPTEKEADLSRAFDLLSDWAGSAALDPQDFDKERGVIVEEWRLSDQNAAGRMQDKVVPMLLGDSQYAKRLPIGDMDIIRNAPVSALADFYHKWYRPDLMAVIAVGDFDVDKVEALVREKFGGLPKPAADAPARPSFAVPTRTGSSALVVKDPENPYTTISIYQSRPARPLQTVGDYREFLLDYLVSTMLDQRYAEVAEKAGAPFLYAYAGNDNLVRGTDIYGLSAEVKEENTLSGLDALMTEFERARRFGFTASELERAKQDVLRGYESAEKERETSESDGYANEYVQLFLNQVASPGIGNEYQLVQRLLPGMTLEDTNRWIAGLVTPDNRAIIVQAPEKADLKLPSEAELVAAVDAAAAKELTAYTDSLAQMRLIDRIPPPAAILSEQKIEDLGVTDIRLANGVRVLMKPTTFKKDEVLFSATSPGGNSLVSDADYPEAAIAAAWIDSSGLGALTETQLTKMLSGKLVDVSPVIDELDEAFYGSASPQDLETALQLVYLYATRPRRDDNSFQVMRDQMETYLKNRSLEPDSVFQDTLSEIFCGKGIRCGALPMSEVQALDESRAFDIYRDRFADFSDFTFTFVGSFDTKTLTPLLQTYLGNLPATGRKETWRNVQQDPPTGVIEKALHKGLDDRARTLIDFSGPISPTLQNEAVLDVLNNVLDLRVIDELRQKLGGTYAPQSSVSMGVLPKPTYDASIDFVSDPKRAEELSKATFDLLDDLRTQGPSESDVSKAKEQSRLAYEKALEENGFWLGQLQGRFTTPGDDPERILQYAAAVAAVTAKDIQDAAQAYLRPDRYVKVVLYPENFDETSGN